jgi:hypothetical protein
MSSQQFVRRTNVFYEINNLLNGNGIKKSLATEQQHAAQTNKEGGDT